MEQVPPYSKEIQENRMLVPAEWAGPSQKIPQKWSQMHWINDLPGKCYCYLWAGMPSHDSTYNLPRGYDFYVISYHIDPVDYVWVEQQALKLQATLIILTEGRFYDYALPDNVICVPWLYWHRQMDLMMEWFPEKKPRDLIYKASAICNRITQSKLIIFTALMENIERSSLLVRLGTWLENRNVHNWQPTGNSLLDNLTDIFKNKYLGTEIKLDDFQNKTHNYQRFTADPWTDTYSRSAIHFTNESFHYSFMVNDKGQACTLPGPFITEKTLKCLVGGTPFVPVGQFDTYGYLSDLGFKFDYGIDLSWDNDPGNLTRLESIVRLILDLKNKSMHDIWEDAQESTKHNFDLIWSGQFYQTCEYRNQKSVDQLLKTVRSI